MSDSKELPSNADAAPCPSRCYSGDLDDGYVPESLWKESLWKAGDIVSRDGTDEHEIVSINEPRDLIEVVCVKAPSEPWTEVGETEHNLTRRYHFVRGGSSE